MNRIDFNANETIAPGAQKTFTFNIEAPSAEGVYYFQWQVLQEGLDSFGAWSDPVLVVVTNELTSADCTNTHFGYHNMLGFDGGNFRFLCSNNQWFDCGSGMSATWDSDASNLQVVGDRVCMIDEFSHWQSSANMSVFVSQHVPTSMIPGSEYEVSLIFENTGTTTWDTGNSPFRLGALGARDNMNWGLNRVSLLTGETIAPAGQKTFTFTVTAPSSPGIYPFQWEMLIEGVNWFGPASSNVNVTVGSFAASDCNDTYFGYHDTVGLNGGDDRFVCFDGKWYDCGWGYNVSWDTPKANGEIIGSWVCNLWLPGRISG